MDYISGEILAIDKSIGWTSFDAVKRLRGALQRRLHLKRFKVGHAGTLDPMATGLLLVCTGRATKRISELQEGTKEYIATLRLGATTPSFDLETGIDATFPYASIREQDVRAVLPQFRGNIMQVPPVFSAVKIDGKRAYALARKGDEPKLEAKPLVIEELELLDYDPPCLRLRIVCSKGTYIRSLARDIGITLGSGAHLTALRRTRIGAYSIADALTIDQMINKINTSGIEYPDWYELPRVE